MDVSTHEITELLIQWRNGDQAALDRLTPLIYDAMRRRAEQLMRAERVGHTLQPTALVHEAYIRLLGQTRTNWRNRVHFLAIAARLMRRMLRDHGRRRHAAKRVGDIEFGRARRIGHGGGPVNAQLLEDALDELAVFDPLQCQIVELRYFGGLTIGEVAEALQVSDTRVKREWRLAKTWLFRRMSGGARQAPAPVPC